MTGPTPQGRLRGGAAMMLVLWATTSVGAFLPALATSSALDRRLFVDASGLLHLDAATGGMGMVAASMAAFGTALLMLSPLLNIAWLHSLAAPTRLAASLERGARRYPAAVLVTLVLSPILAAAVGLAAIPAWGVSVLLAESAAPTHDLAVLFSALPGVAAVAAWATWHDLARASVAATGDSPLAAIARARGHLAPRVVGRYVLYFAAAVALTAAGLGLVALVPVGAAVVLGQLLVIGRIGLRALLLAGFVAAVGR